MRACSLTCLLNKLFEKKLFYFIIKINYGIRISDIVDFYLD